MGQQQSELEDMAYDPKGSFTLRTNRAPPTGSAGSGTSHPPVNSPTTSTWRRQLQQ